MKKHKLYCIILIVGILSLLAFSSCKVDSLKKGNGVEIKSSIFTVDENELYVSVPNSQTEFSFLDAIDVPLGTVYSVCVDLQCNNAIRSKTTNIFVGDNIFYILVQDFDTTKLYKATIRRRPVYSVKFDTRGGTPVAEQKIEEGSCAIEPETTRVGGELKKWNYDFDKPIMSNITISAEWILYSYDISYELNGGINASTNRIKYSVEDYVLLDAPTKKGYTFVGWSDNGVIKKGSTGNKKFTANWTKTYYQIIYDLDGGINNVNNATSYSIDDEITLLPPTRDGYIFKGWSDNGKILKGNVGVKKFTALWEAIIYNISYELDGGVNSDDNPSTYTPDDQIVLSAPVKLGYTFIGWSDDGVINKGDFGNKIFTANWSVDIILSDDGHGVIGLNNREVKHLTILSEYNGRSITYIGESAFYNEHIESAEIHEGIVNIYSNAFRRCPSLTSIIIPSSVEFISSGVFWECSLTKVSIPENVTQIFKDTFHGCYDLKEVNIPNGCTYIGEAAFQGCRSLEKVTFPSGLTTIKALAFNGCDGLKEITIPGSVKEMGVGAFSAKGIINLKIESGVTCIGLFAFSGCYYLKQITIPMSVTIIEQNAFQSDMDLQDVFYEGSEDDWKKVNVGGNNEYLLNARMHYLCKN